MFLIFNFDFFTDRGKMVSLSNVQLWLLHDWCYLFNGQLCPNRQSLRLQRSFHLVSINLISIILVLFKIQKITNAFLFYHSKNGTVATQFKNQFPISQFQTGEINVPGLDLKVVDTDYTSYILWHACYSDTKTGTEFERIVVATRSIAPVSRNQDAIYDSLISQKIFNNNNNQYPIPPYGRCNCDKI